MHLRIRKIVSQISKKKFRPLKMKIAATENAKKFPPIKKNAPSTSPKIAKSRAQSPLAKLVATIPLQFSIFSPRPVCLCARICMYRRNHMGAHTHKPSAVALCKYRMWWLNHNSVPLTFSIEHVTLSAKLRFWCITTIQAERAAALTPRGCNKNSNNNHHNGAYDSFPVEQSSSFASNICICHVSEPDEPTDTGKSAHTNTDLASPYATLSYSSTFVGRPQSFCALRCWRSVAMVVGSFFRISFNSQSHLPRSRFDWE